MDSLRTISYVGSHPVAQKALDNAVHTAASEMASDANNDGARAQIYFLKNVCGWSDEDIAQEIGVPAINYADFFVYAQFEQGNEEEPEQLQIGVVELPEKTAPLDMPTSIEINGVVYKPEY